MADEKREGFTIRDRRGEADEGQAQQPSPSSEAATASVGEARRALPEIDFSTFVMSLASSALLYLGELRAPGEQQARLDLSMARQTIDILGMLHDKTRGNLTENEEKLIEHLVYDLRLKFVDAKKRAG